MSTPRNLFVTEGNVEIYLSRLYVTWDAHERATLLRLVAEEETRMGESQEHVQNGERRVIDGRERIQRQRQIVDQVAADQRSSSRAVMLLETLERTQELLEWHLQRLQNRLEQRKL